MHNIGDEVRLIRGWTRMVVIGFTSSGVMIAKYDAESYSQMNRVQDSDFENPQYASGTKKRYPNEFVKWDGAPATKVYYTMNKTYRILSGPHAVKQGTYLSTASNGKLVLELANGEVITCNPQYADEVVPFTFRVKSIANNYRCTYTSPPGVTIRKGEILVSKSGNIYSVLETNTKERVSKGVFDGTRLVQEEL